MLMDDILPKEDETMKSCALRQAITWFKKYSDKNEPIITAYVSNISPSDRKITVVVFWS